jgi:hypothetical protein
MAREPGRLIRAFDELVTGIEYCVPGIPCRVPGIPCHYSKFNRFKCRPDQHYRGQGRHPYRFCKRWRVRRIQHTPLVRRGLLTMSPFRRAKLFRPLFLAFVPVTAVLTFYFNSFVGAALWLMAIGTLGWLTACSRCKRSAYFDAERPWRTLLAIPHHRCTNCGQELR